MLGGLKRRSSKFSPNQTMYKKVLENEFSVKHDRDDLPPSLLNQHVSQLARNLYNSERKKAIGERKFHFPNLDCTTFKQKASHLTLIEEIFILAIRLEVAELK